MPSRPTHDTDCGGRRTSLRAWLVRVLAVCFWLVVWQAASVAIDARIILVGPVEVVCRLGKLALTGEFWASVGLSLARIALGFSLAAVLGAAVAVLASRFGLVRALVSPVVTAVKAAPVASFVILVLLWVSSRQLSVIISFLMAFPVVYTNVLEGIRSTDPGLLEMARVFGVRGLDLVRSVYLSEVLPYVRAALSLAVGLSWKAGIAAEVIGLPDLSIGEHLYDAKVYLDTPSLFAWTLAVILLSVAIEALIGRAVGAAVSRWEARP